MLKPTSWMQVARIAVVVCAGAGTASQMGMAQLSTQQPQVTYPGQQHNQAPLTDSGNADVAPDLKARMEEQQRRANNEDRHKKLLADTDRLVALANELKAEVSKSQKDELNVVVVRKAAEMEKLAHDVRTRMSY